MTAQSGGDAVRVSVTVPVPPSEAFARFTDGFADWWPEKQGFTGAPLSSVGFEGREGALWTEHTSDGDSMKWGRVLAWQPPERIVLSWELTPEWATTENVEEASRIEVRFAAADEYSTQVTLTHSEFQRHGDGGGSMREAMASESEGWPYLLNGYRRALETG
ncbi:SRPBCC family protein [Streptomyces sp. NPDC050211]|jgi:uncharacterized protein YndB with AHSA1/START domain|uniref:SRPBCC family protein n=1 Tax=Streptomyces sp. NPDC050211 TaxID=3154932 RepID=UPI00342F1EAD